MVKKITILGSTGSIGTQALEVLENIENREEFELVGLACNSNLEKFIPQIEKFRPRRVCVSDYTAYKALKTKADCEVLFGNEGLIEIAASENDILLSATSGNISLKPTVEAIKNGIDIALANKETLVEAGDYVMDLAKKTKSKTKDRSVRILPVDSEHSAVFQASGGNFSTIRNIFLTASGGPFLNKTEEEINSASAKDALKHPNWSMGKKITIDSSTLMNKGLEVIEAHHLFNIPYENIKVVIHPESVIHSAIETKDGSVLAQIGTPSMHIPIQYALTYPNRKKGIKTDSFSFFDRNLTFQSPDFKKFPCLKLAFEAGKKGGIFPCVLNASNEIAVYKFLKGEINIQGIVKTVEFALQNAFEIKSPSLEDIFNTDIETRKKIQNYTP